MSRSQQSSDVSCLMALSKARQYAKSNPGATSRHALVHADLPIPPIDPNDPLDASLQKDPFYIALTCDISEDPYAFMLAIMHATDHLEDLRRRRKSVA